MATCVSPRGTAPHGVGTCADLWLRVSSRQGARSRCGASHVARGLRTTRPGRAAHLRNYKGVIPPRLWKTLWITLCEEWRTGLSGTPSPVVHQLCTPSRTALVPQEPVLLTDGAGVSAGALDGSVLGAAGHCGVDLGAQRDLGHAGERTGGGLGIDL